jgi:polyisoprenoid-binding protein YceI
MSGAAATPSALAGDYVMDPAHSRLGFVARHTMFAKVHGQFNEFEGNGHLDPNNAAEAHAHVTIQVSSDTIAMLKTALLRIKGHGRIAWPGSAERHVTQQAA